MNDVRLGATDQRATEDDRLVESLEILYKAYALKDLPRAGWVLRGISGPESVAAHSWGTALLCLMFADEAGVDGERAAAIAVVHDLAEAVAGDVVARADPADREVSESDKAALEALAVAELMPSESHRFAHLRRLWHDYEDRADAAARFARDMNLIDMCLQAVVYERERRYDSNMVMPSTGGFDHLDEFFVSAAHRLDSEIAKRLFAEVRARYLEAR